MRTHIQKNFRSRGFKYNICTNELSMKEYYDPDMEVLHLNADINYISNKMRCLEYSMTKCRKIDSVNFHTDCNNIEAYTLYAFNDSVTQNITHIFDKSYKAYTIGYRLTARSVSGMSVYYYPTIWKKDRFGICGITSHDEIFNQVNRFLHAIDATECCRDTMIKYASKIVKFKGCCITTGDNGIISYKLYFRMDPHYIKEFFGKIVDIRKLEECFGNTILIAVRFHKGNISGYNFYYLK